MLKNTQIEQRNKVQETFSGLKMQAWLYPTAISEWLGNNIENACRAVSGKSCRPLSSIGQHYYKVKTVENRPVLVIRSAWNYTHSFSTEPDVSLLNTLVTDIKVEKIKSTSTSEKLSVAISINLDKWPNLVVGLLHQNLCGSVINADDSVSAKKNRASNLKILLKAYYPTLNAESLMVAHELGVIDGNCNNFAPWLESFKHLEKVKELNLPDLDDTFTY